MSTKNYVYIFLAGLLCFAVFAAQPVSVQASVTVTDEIEQQASQTEEKPVNELSVPQPTEVEPVSSEEMVPEGESTTENTDEEQKVADEETNKQEEISVQTPKCVRTPVEPVVQKPVQEKKSIHLSLSKIFNKFSDFFANLPFDKVAEFKDTVLQHLESNRFFCKLCPKQVEENKQIVVTKEFAPYYFLYPETNNCLEKIAFPDRITKPEEFLPYSYMIKNPDIKIQASKNTVTPQGTTDIWVLANAPSPKIEVIGKSMYAKLVIDIRNNTLYKYDKEGFPLKAYLVATGARGTRTMPGLRVVTYKEHFPYAGAPDSKRALDPYSYGPYIIFMNVVDPKTGRQYVVEQLLHGNGNEYSIGKKVSHGCVRTNNKVMRCELSKEVKRGDYVLLINPDVI
ncbi:MAG: L,D-transpeptidase family protein [Cyanobacteria bacterium RUI128]|nr:L,D-transpeptidase family protein [Cyanobacteria bacterium RUI128]